MTTTRVENKNVLLHYIKEYFKSFAVLRECPVRYWGVQIINILDCMAYFALLIVMTIFLSKEFGFSDEQAGYVFTLIGIVVSISLMVAGPITDWLGVRISLCVALVTKLVMCVGIAWLAFNPEFNGRNTAVVWMFGIMAVTMAMIQTIFQITNKRFTTKKTQSPGFNFWYLFMNVGAMLAGFLVDALGKKGLGLPTTYVILVGAATSVLSLIVVATMIRNEDQAIGEGEKCEDNNGQSAKNDSDIEIAQPSWIRDGFFWEVYKQIITYTTRKGPIAIVFKVVTQRVFWKLVALITLLLGVRAVFIYMNALMPKYWLRVIGEDAAIGTLNAINPALVILGIILLVPLMSKWNVFKMLTRGAIVSAASLFILAIPVAHIFGNVAMGYYITASVSMVILAVGEVFWSPRLQQYTAAIAPDGQVGTYLGLSMITWFGAKTLVGAASGHMLTRWCPEGIGERIRTGTVVFTDSPEFMWLILGTVAIIGPILIIVFKNRFLRGARFEETR